MSALLRLLAVVLFVAGVVCADTVVGSGHFVGGWTATNAGDEYWDHRSWDGVNCNIGYYISGALSGCSSFAGSPGPQAVLPFWADAGSNTAADPDFYFSSTLDGSQITLKLEIAGLAGMNELWAYFHDPAMPDKLLFAGGTSPGSSLGAVYFNPAGNDFGLYIKTGNNQRFYTESSMNIVDPGAQHFTVFREAPPGVGGNEVRVYWIGIEDLPGPFKATGGSGFSDWDYNDMGIRVSVLTPEPASFLLALPGLLLLYRRRARRG